MLINLLLILYFVFKVFCIVIQLQSVACVENKTRVKVKNGFREILSLWPIGLKRTNMVVASLPLRLAMNKLAVVATGKAKEELMTSLNVICDKNLTEYYTELIEPVRYARETSLIMLNRLFIDESTDIDPRFLKDADTFGVQVQKARFNVPRIAVTAINQWVELATFRRITDIISEKDIDRSTSMVLINALHMKLTWTTPFDVRFSIMKPFTLLNKTQVTMRMMTALCTRFYYTENTEHKFQLIRFSLDCPGCRITYVLPSDVTGLPKLLNVIAEHPYLIPNTLRYLKEEELNVRLPVMKIKTFINWNRYLKGIGIKQIFDRNNSGLDAISKPNHTKNYHMSQVLSKVFLDVDEFGIHRKAPNEPIDFSSLRKQGPVVQFIADHPFYFRIDFVDYLKEVYELFSGVFYGTD